MKLDRDPDFDELLEAELRPQPVLLQKDKKTICRSRPSRSLSIPVPSIWTICEFEKKRECTLPYFRLYPEPEDAYQRNEWVVFLSFLRKNNKVAVVKTKVCIFYVSPPSEVHESVSATVLYKRIKEVHCSPEKDGHISGSMSRVPIVCKSQEAVKMENARNNFVRTDPSYLVTLAQSHAGWIFGAIVELVDNSRDAKAVRLGISINSLYSKHEEKKIPVLSVIDNGCGMIHEEVVRMLSFGHKQPKKDELDRIGRFGIGFKTGAMKLGRDAIVLTQTLVSRSVAFLSQSFNESKENLEIPIISYRKHGNYMEIDLDVQSEEIASCNLQAIKKFSPFNEYFIGEKVGLFGENGTGTQIYIWNLDKWGSDYSLEWQDARSDANDLSQSQGDILVRSRRIRSRPGQISKQVPLDYSLQAYLEVIFLEPCLEIHVQGSLVQCRRLVKSLENTMIVKDVLLGKPIKLTLGYCPIEHERANCGMFLYWHGRLIEAYKRVGGMIHSADFGRGVIGVVDVSDLMTDGNAGVWVLNNKQGFQDCESYAKLEEWLGKKSDEYWDSNYDPVQLKKVTGSYKAYRDWVQCNKCLKWRVLCKGYDISSLPCEWFCYMSPFCGRCEIREEENPGVVTVGLKRFGSYEENAGSKEWQNIVRIKSKCNVTECYGDNLITKVQSGSTPQVKPAKTGKTQKLGETCIADSEVLGSDLEETNQDEEGTKLSHASEANSDGDSSTIADFPRRLKEKDVPGLAPLKRLRRGLKKGQPYC